MCGIVGTVYCASQVDPELLAFQMDTLIHRGPDDSGVWISDDGRVGLAHRRLSIIDLSPSGKQPMHYEGDRYHIVFNGEIYNFIELRGELVKKGHRFKSSSDTEVVLASYAEWGTDCLGKLNGMFAFGLFDSRRQTLFIARDRAGEKPLFYKNDQTGISFASELKALMADPAFERKINPVGFECYLAFGHVPGTHCILDGLNKLPPAHALEFNVNTGTSKIWEYWKLPNKSPSCDETSREHETYMEDQLEFLLEDSVKRQLVSDVPVGILLSGGVDSSLITAMAVRHSADVKTFTIRFPGFGVYDETEHSRLVSRHFGTRHVELEADPSTVDLLPTLAQQFDEPIIDSSMVPTFLVSKLVKKYCTVALGGDGGDELFGGYEQYRRILGIKKSLGWIPHFFREKVAGAAGKYVPIGLKGRNWIQNLDVDFANGLPPVGNYFDSYSRTALISPDVMKNFRSFSTADRIRSEIVPSCRDIVQRATRMDFKNYLPEDILVKVDRCSMLNSLEVRAPWLDYRLIEFAFGTAPSEKKVSTSCSKILPKKLISRLLPKHFDTGRKQGFSIPLASWLEEKSWRNYFREVLLDFSHSFFNRPFIESLLAGQDKGRSNSERLFGLVMFTLWRNHYKISV